jgi:hypothetical protein
LKLKEYDSLVYSDSTLIHKGGGHKITMHETGKRSGDLSFAEVVLQCPDMEDKNLRFYHPDGGRNSSIEFGKYMISVIAVGWNAAFVSLEIRDK